MKIVGQSIAVDGAPYVHLGYVAAAQDPGPRPAGPAASVWLLGAGLTVAALAAAQRVKYRWVRRLLTISLVILGLSGLALNWLFRAQWEFRHSRYRDAVERSHATAVAALDRIGRLRDEGKPAPVTTDDWHRMFPREELLDRWDREMRLATIFVGEDSALDTIQWAGPDGVFGTADDGNVAWSWRSKATTRAIVRQDATGTE